MTECTRFYAVTGIALLGALVWGRPVRAQDTDSVFQQPASAEGSAQGQVSYNVTIPCIQPPALVRWEDYNGKLQRVVGAFARRLERKSIHPPHYKPGAVLCTLETKDKFLLFVQDTVDPVTFLSVGFDAGLDQAQNTDRTFGQGAEGYGKRFGANFAGEVSSEFFKDFAYPGIFSEDPRYYRLAHGSAPRRFAHALEHAFVAYRENGTHMLNASEWLGTTSAAVLSNLYHPGNRRGFAPVAQRVSFAVLEDVGFDVLREFWPEIARKLKLPFRDQHNP